MKNLVVAMVILGGSLMTHTKSQAGDMGEPAAPAKEQFKSAEQLIREKTANTPVQAGFVSLFKPESGSQWEPWLVYHDGLFYNFTDADGDAGRKRHVPGGIHALLLSDDGVYWSEYGRFQTVNDLIPPGNDNGARIGGAFQIHRFEDNGPWIMHYSVVGIKSPATGKQFGTFRIGIATSEDLIHWKATGKFLEPDERFYSSNGRWDTILAERDPNGGWLAVLDGQANGKGIDKNRFAGESVHYVARGHTRDGIDWEWQPPIPLIHTGTQVSLCQLLGMKKIGDHYFIVMDDVSGTANCVRAFISDKIEGPYRLLNRNDPVSLFCGYGAVNRIGDSVVLTGFIRRRLAKPHSGSYRFMIKECRSDGENLWLRWWAPNDRLKARSLHISELPAPAQDTPVVYAPERREAGKVMVIEGTIDLPEASGVIKETNWAMAAKVLDGDPGCSAMVDGSHLTSWTTLAKHGVTISLDLGARRRIGRVRVYWKTHPWGQPGGLPSEQTVSVSDDGQKWTTAFETKSQEPSQFFFRVTELGPINAEARFVRYSFKAEGNGKSGQSGISELNVLSDAEESLGDRPGFFFEMSDGSAEALVLNPDGTTRYGRCDGNGRKFVLYATRDPDLGQQRPSRFRIVQFDDLIEVYLNDCFVQEVVLPAMPTDRIGFLTSGGKNMVRDLKAWYADYELAKQLPNPNRSRLPAP